MIPCVAGALDTPVSAKSVAKLLRICPGLPKDAVGSYLGENGKEKPQFEWEAIAFHKEVLHHYVRSFELSNLVSRVLIHAVIYAIV